VPVEDEQKTTQNVPTSENEFFIDPSNARTKINPSVKKRNEEQTAGTGLPWYKQNPLLLGVFVTIALFMALSLILFAVILNFNSKEETNDRNPTASATPKTTPTTTTSTPTPESSPAESPVDTANTPQLAFWLNIQKMKDGETDGMVFKASGNETFSKGDKFQFNFKSTSGGFFYLFSEGVNDRGEVTFYILFLTPKQNNGKAETSMNSQTSSGWNTFGGIAGKEIVWLIWTNENNLNLEGAKTMAFSGEGEIKDSAIRENLRAFLKAESNNQPTVSKDSNSGDTLLRPQGKVLVYRLELEHK